MIRRAIELIKNEKDTDQYRPYPLDKITLCLNVVDEAKKGLETTIRYLEAYTNNVFLFISGWETAMVIDKISEDFKIKSGASDVYQHQQNQWKASCIFPLGEIKGWSFQSEEFDEQLSYTEYFEKLSEKYPTHGTSSKGDIRKALVEMKKMIIKLQLIREAAIDYIVSQGCWEDGIDVTAEIDITDGSYWEVITLPRTGQSFRRVSQKERMERVLVSEHCQDKISINRRRVERKDMRRDLYCRTYYDWKTVFEAVEVVKRVVPVMKKIIISEEEWISECNRSLILKQFIKNSIVRV